MLKLVIFPRTKTSICNTRGPSAVSSFDITSFRVFGSSCGQVCCTLHRKILCSNLETFSLILTTQRHLLRKLCNGHLIVHYTLYCTSDDVHSVYRNTCVYVKHFCRIHLVTITLCPLTTSALKLWQIQILT